MSRLRDPAVLVRLADMLAAFAVIVVLRDVLGGADSGVAPLVVLPVLFMAVKGTRLEVAITVVVAVLVVAVPIVVAGEPDYPPSEWRRAIGVAVVTTIAGWLVHRATQAHRDAEADLAAVAEVARSIRHDEDPRTAVCRAGSEVAGATMAMFAEPDGEGHLVLTAALGTDVEVGETVSLEEEPSGAATAYATGRRLFVSDVGERPALARGFAGRARVASALWEPVAAGPRLLGVLIVGWERRIARPSDRAVRLIRLLADEAANAIEREDLRGEMRTTARTDPLTGVLNERAWRDELPREIARAQRAATPLCIALLDVDGQPEERGLKELVAGWTAALRPGDRLARLDALRFAIMLPGCAASDACRVFERVRAVRPRGVQVSVGLTEWHDGEPPERLIHRADDALAAARRAGPDRLVLA
ncbi:MAG TPA: sensor domain-containing diguanylate cyclase [Solirubrobacteraceae bacterium]|nr:sensor domain-containing diguanylate cyclase [Solirubrobacteraceae bacterium]